MSTISIQSPVQAQKGLWIVSRAPLLINSAIAAFYY